MDSHKMQFNFFLNQRVTKCQINLSLGLFASFLCCCFYGTVQQHSRLLSRTLHLSIIMKLREQEEKICSSATCVILSAEASRQRFRSCHVKKKTTKINKNLLVPSAEECADKHCGILAPEKLLSVTTQTFVTQPSLLVDVHH